MAEVTQNSYAKINLTLDVLEKRPDSYHEVRMIMQTVKLNDTVQILTSDKPDTIELKANLPYLPTDSRN
ncbi:MAG: 4-(cytidine 5'-diphospho)-2-C-methyl-D-erythritol kinase, partial [Clostridiales bacterium]|nr:4-(cytidine 5'-diphospho)-2-C-methyl-D-erythritol kinase [Clostridiales bacterium]